MPPNKLTRSLLSLREKFNSLTFQLYPSMLGQIREDGFTFFYRTALNDLL